MLDQAPRGEDDLRRGGKPGHLLPACPLPAAPAYISSIYSTVVLLATAASCARPLCRRNRSGHESLAGQLK